MIEALRFCTPNNSEGLYVDGDVIVIALPNHPWGTDDKIVHAVCEIDDPEKENLLLAKQQAGDAWPVFSYPYADYEIIEGSAEVVVNAISTKHIDISQLRPERQSIIRDRVTPVAKLKLTECLLKER